MSRLSYCPLVNEVTLDNSVTGVFVNKIYQHGFLIRLAVIGQGPRAWRDLPTCSDSRQNREGWIISRSGRSPWVF